MAESTWAKTTNRLGSITYTTTMNSTDGSAILPINPTDKVTILGVYDTASGGNANVITVLASVTQTLPVVTADMVAESTTFSANFSDVFAGPITGVQFDSSGTDSHDISVLVTGNFWKGN